MFKTTKTGFLKAACLMLAVMMLAACVISGTMAKYVSKGAVSADGLTLTVAAWDVQVNGVTLGEPNSVGSPSWEIENLDDVNAEKPADGKIAPGTWGYAAVFTITNNSDVDAIVTISGIDSLELSGVTSGGPEFMVVVAENPPGSYDESAGSDTFRVGLTQSGGSTILYICYKWEFGEETDDTSLAGKDLTFSGSLTVTAEQASEPV